MKKLILSGVGVLVLVLGVAVYGPFGANAKSLAKKPSPTATPTPTAVVSPAPTSTPGACLQNGSLCNSYSAPCCDGLLCDRYAGRCMLPVPTSTPALMP